MDWMENIHHDEKAHDAVKTFVGTELSLTKEQRILNFTKVLNMKVLE